LIAGFRGRAVATEEWHVNAPIAARRLAAVGAAVVRANTGSLPFADAAFDLVLSRHEAIAPSEVARVLAPGGTVLTQQVWSHRNELSRFFPRRTDYGDHFSAYQVGFRAAGLQVIDAREHETPVAYANLGEYVYLLLVAPFDLPDFDPLGADLPALLAMEAALTTPNGFVLTEGSYIIEARKSAR
jgi:SAM-dependent methyltransferase